jgi:hypothetical protein
VDCAANCVRIHPHSNDMDSVTMTPVGPDLTILVMHVFHKYGNPNDLRLAAAASEYARTLGKARASTRAYSEHEMLALKAYELRVYERGLLNPMVGVMPGPSAAA